MPVCECGNIPVARRLIMSGMPVSLTISFLLAAPILNPITLFATYEAFRGNLLIFWGRIIGAIIITLSIGLVLSKVKNIENQITPSFALCCKHQHNDSESIMQKSFKTYANEFWEVMRMMIIGAFIASVTQVFIPRSIIQPFAQDPILGVFAMIGLAFIISICSNVDAFFALAYSNLFKTGSILSFLLFGPMIDIKILAMMKGVFKAKFLIWLSLSVFLISSSISIFVNKFLV